MDLRKYLFRKRKSVTDFAKEVKVSRNHISRIVNKSIKPGKHLALFIETITNGEVTASELLDEKAEKIDSK